jgi:hypothetical protein
VASFDEAIPPGQAGKVTASVRTDGLAGSVSKVVTVQTNDPARTTFPLTLKATIVASVNFYPSRSLFLSIGQTEDNTARTILRKDDTETGALAVTELTSSVPWITATARRIDAAGQAAVGLPPTLPGDYLLEAKLTGPAPKVPTPVELRFKTGLAREPEASVQLTVRVLPELMLSTPQVILPAPAPGVAAQGAVFLTVRRDLDPSELQVMAEPPPFKVEKSPSGEHRYALQLSWKDEPAGSAPRDGRLTVVLGGARATANVRVLPPQVPDAPVVAPPQGAGARAPSEK